MDWQDTDVKAQHSSSFIIFLFGICPVSSLLTKLCKGCINKIASSETHFGKLFAPQWLCF